MGERSDEIKSHIEDTRQKLGDDLSELEYRVRKAADWRARFRENPGALMAMAMGGGLLLGYLSRGDSD